MSGAPGRGGLAAALRSMPLALALLAGLVLLSAVGTVTGPRLEALAAQGALPAWAATSLAALGLLHTWRSPPFVAMAALLAASVGACTWNRLASRARGAASWHRTALAAADAGTHLSLLAVAAAGAGSAFAGVVGTQYLFVGRTVESVTLEDDREFPLGFGVLLRERREEHYPGRLRLGVTTNQGARIGLAEVREGGGAVSLGAGGLRASLRELDPGARRAVVRVEGGGAPQEVALRLDPGAGEGAEVGGVRLRAVAWRRDLRAVRGRVAILEGGRQVREAWLEVNGAVVHRGTRLCLTSWGEDREGNRFLGVQARRDPTAPLFWAGAAVGAVALPAFIALRRR